MGGAISNLHSNLLLLRGHKVNTRTPGGDPWQSAYRLGQRPPGCCSRLRGDTAHTWQQNRLLSACSGSPPGRLRAGLSQPDRNDLGRQQNPYFIKGILGLSSSLSSGWASSPVRHSTWPFSEFGFKLVPEDTRVTLHLYQGNLLGLH